MPSFRLRVDTRVNGECQSAKCRAPLDWYRTESGKSMPMNRGAVAIEVHVVDGMKIGTFDSADSHWATCPARNLFHHKGRR
jgi:hypothetical protein